MREPPPFSMRCHIWRKRHILALLSGINLSTRRKSMFLSFCTVLIMEITLGYAIGLGSVLITLAFINLLSSFPYSTSFAPHFLRQAFRYLTYPYLVRRHRFLGPWTRADVIIQLAYITSNSFCLGFRSSIAKAGLRAGSLSLINLIPLFLGPHLGFLADILGVSLSTFRHLHRSAGLMSSGLVLFHALIVIISRTAFALHGVKNLSGVVVST